MTTSWPTWIQLEQYSALHNLPFATKEDGFEGLDAELVFNSKPHVKHIERLLEMAKDGSFKYAGRDTAARPAVRVRRGRDLLRLLAAPRQHGEVAQSSTGREAYLPYDPDIIKSPMNSIIGGASLWTMTAPNRTPAEYKARCRVPAIPRHSPRMTRLGTEHRLRARDARRLRTVEAAGLLRQEPRRRHPGASSSPAAQ